MAYAILDVAKLIREAADVLELELIDCKQGTRRWAEIRLAWDNLVSAHDLLTTGRLTPDDLVWGAKAAKKSVSG